MGPPPCLARVTSVGLIHGTPFKVLPVMSHPEVAQSDASVWASLAALETLRNLRGGSQVWHYSCRINTFSAATLDCHLSSELHTESGGESKY